jgi:GDPmannose 4,6-dehydratase
MPMLLSQRLVDVRTALITGIAGQDGSFLAELLLNKGYVVHGVVRRSSSVARGRLDHLGEVGAHPRLHVHYGDLTDSFSLVRLIERVVPDEVYNLAAQSHVRISFELPEFTGDVTGLGALRVLEAVRLSGVPARIYQASSSEMFGASPPPQNEQTPFHPRSPYGVAKVYAYWATANYRESYGMYASNGILFNHESERRGENFVTRKITKGVAAIVAGRASSLALGNLEARRDWGFAGDFVDAMWMMLQHDRPDDFVIATGRATSVREFCAAAFSHVGLDYERYVVTDSSYFRPAEVDHLCGDASKAQRELGWAPRTDVDALVRRMVDHDLAAEGVSERVSGRLAEPVITLA